MPGPRGQSGVTHSPPLKELTAWGVQTQELGRRECWAECGVWWRCKQMAAGGQCKQTAVGDRAVELAGRSRQRPAPASSGQRLGCAPGAQRGSLDTEHCCVIPPTPPPRATLLLRAPPTQAVRSPLSSTLCRKLQAPSFCFSPFSHRWAASPVQAPGTAP